MRVSKITFNDFSDSIEPNFHFLEEQSIKLEEEYYSTDDPKGKYLKSFSLSSFDYFKENNNSIFFYLVSGEIIINKISLQSRYISQPFSDWEPKNSLLYIKDNFKVTIHCFEINTIEKYLDVMAYLFAGYTSKSFLLDKELNLSVVGEEMIYFSYNRNNQFRDYHINIQYLLNLGYIFIATRGGFDYGSYCMFLFYPIPNNKPIAP